MKIGLVAPPWFPVPPPLYGGSEEVVDGLARGLTELGHDVRLFTVGESTCPVHREHLYPSGIEPFWATDGEAAHVLAAYDALGDVDVIHDHTLVGPLLAQGSGLPHPPVVVTVHSDVTPITARILGAVSRVATVVAISASQARRAHGVRIDAVVHHGIDLQAYSPGPGDGGYLLFVGRMSPDKGVDVAIRIARRAGLPLRIVAKTHEPAEIAYFEEVIRPLLGPDDEPPVELAQPERTRLMQHAIGVINPIRWPEPFGLVMVESLACGTPVVAFPRGAAPEIVRPGVTGFLPVDEDQAITSVSAIATLGRRACRQDAEQRFSLQRMARDYERLYRRALGRAPSLPVPRRGRTSAAGPGGSAGMTQAPRQPVGSAG
jgi:glycosyltransferase involved in cell wall biosynthesis